MGGACHQGTDERPDAKPGGWIHCMARAKIKHAFRVIKRQFECVKVRYRCPAKNTTPLHTLFARSNL